MAKYDPDQIRRAIAVVQSCGSLKQAARETGIARTTLREWMQGKLPKGTDLATVTPTGEEVAKVGQDRAGEFRSVAKLYLTHLRRPEVVKETKAKDAATVVGILEDKAVRAEGGATSVNEQRSVVYVMPTALRDMSGDVIDGRLVEPMTLSLPEGAGIGDGRGVLLERERVAP